MHDKTLSYLTNMWGLVVLFVLLIMAPASFGDRTCAKVDSCSCRFTDDGTTMSLVSLASNDGTPRFSGTSGDEDGHQNYTYNPCTPFTSTGCKDSTICRQNYTDVENLADASAQVAIVYDDLEKTMTITYVSGHGGIVSSVAVECVDHQEDPVFTPYGEIVAPVITYNFRLLTKCGCLGACPIPSTSSDSGLSAGSVLLIVIFVILLVYLVLGTLHGKLVRKAQGVEMLPNYDFWAALPGYAKDGCLYIVRCACCRPQTKQYDEV